MSRNPENAGKRSTSVRRLGRFIVALVPLALIGLGLLIFGALDAVPRFVNFTSLTKDKLVAEARAFVRERYQPHGTALAVCLYEVDCSSGHARLAIVPDIDAWDLEAVKARIWKRRFEPFCEGRTTNIALHVLAEGHVVDSYTHLVWSFFNNRFIPSAGRFYSSSFSEEPWERCTVEKAIAAMLPSP